MYYLSGYLTSGVNSDPVQLAGGAALLDVVAALTWVRRNIAAFGGDPRRVTLAGHAAGAALANTIIMMPESKGHIKNNSIFYYPSSVLHAFLISDFFTE